MGLLAAYSFDNLYQTGQSIPVSGTIPDASGNGNTLTVSNSAMSVSAGPPKYGSAVVGDNSTSAQVSSTTSIKPTTAVTWMCWVKVTGNSYGWGQIFGRCNDDTNWGDAFSFYMKGDEASTYKIQAVIQTDSSTTDTITDTLTLNTWMHIAASWSTTDGVLKFYLNGNYSGNINTFGTSSIYYGSGGNTTKHFNIFLNEQYSERGNQVQIDDVRVFDTELTPAQIVTYMNTPVEVSPPVISGISGPISSGSTSTISMNPQTNLLATGNIMTGDWIILMMSSASNASGTNIPTPGAGWTTLSAFGSVGTGNVTFGMWAHQYTNGETYTWTQTTGAGNTTNYRFVHIRGAADISLWTIGSFDTRQSTGTSTTNVATSITTALPNTLAFLTSEERTTAAETDAQVTSTNFTKVLFDNTYDQTFLYGIKSMPVVGATGSSTITYPNSQASNGIAGIIAIPAPYTQVSIPWLRFN